MFERNGPKSIFRRKNARRLPFSLIAIALLLLLFGLVPVNRSLEPETLEIIAEKTFTPIPSIPPSPIPTSTKFPKPSGPSGGRIIFTCTRGNFNHLCMINRDGSGFFRLTDGVSQNYYPTFAPQGGAYVYASNRVGGTFDLFMMVMNTSSLLQLTHKIGNAFSPDFSPDGEQIVFGNRAAEGPSSLWIATRTGESPRLLHEGRYAIVAVAWSPLGNRIAFAMALSALQNEFDIFLLDVNNQGEPRRLNTGLLGIGGSLDWSPDGRYLLLYAGPPGDKDIFRYEVETGIFAQLTNGGNNASAAYSPDGKWIVFNSLRIGDQADLYLMRADGSDEQRLTDDPEPDWQPQWEP